MVNRILSVLIVAAMIAMAVTTPAVAATGADAPAVSGQFDVAHVGGSFQSIAGGGDTGGPRKCFSRDGVIFCMG